MTARPGAARAAGEAAGFSTRILELNAHDLSRFVPFRVGAAQVGWLRPAAARELRAYPGVFDVAGLDAGLDEYDGESGGAVTLAAGLDSAQGRTRALAGAARDLHGRGVLPHWYGEDYLVVPWGDRLRESEPLLTLERAAAPFFGVRAFGIHVNGFVRAGGGEGEQVRMWIARRSGKYRSHAGRLDQIVAGGLTAGLTAAQVMVKECAEEAGIGPGLARGARPCGHVSYCVETPRGLSPATIFVFDLELPPAFVPRNHDGEVAEFRLLRFDDVLALVAEGRAFKPNCNLVVIDFALRHGLLPLGEADRAALEAGLRQ